MIEGTRYSINLSERASEENPRPILLLWSSSAKISTDLRRKALNENRKSGVFLLGVRAAERLVVLPRGGECDW